MKIVCKNGIEFYTHDQLELHQSKMLEILDWFTKLCKKYEIRYWLDGGSLLGIKRHNGEFIPWDDDIDICVPVGDYKKLINVIKSEDNSPYFLYYDETGFKFWCEYLCMHDHASVRYDGLIQPIKIDLFPVKFIDKDGLETDISEVESVARYLKSGKGVGVFENGIGIINNVKSKDLAIDNYWNYVETKIEKSTSFWLTKGHGQYSPLGKIEVNKVFPLKESTFCGIDVLIPNDVNSYLEQCYSRNYMNFPKLKGRSPTAYGLIEFSNSNEFMKEVMKSASIDNKSFYFDKIKIGKLYKLLFLIKRFGIKHAGKVAMKYIKEVLV